MRDPRPGTHRVYVLRLRNGELYVGSTGLTVRERAANHRAGYKAARICRKVGVRRIEWELTLNAPSADSRSAVEVLEARYARKLRKLYRGVKVHQH